MTYCADLAAIGHDTLSGPRIDLVLFSSGDRAFDLLRNSKLHISIVKDDGWRLSTQLKSHTLQVALRGVFLDLASGCRASGERNLTDLHVRGEELACHSTAVDNVDGAWRKALLDQGSESESSQGGFLGWLEDEGVSGSETGLDMSQRDYIQLRGRSLTAAFQAKRIGETFQAPIPAQTPMGSF